MHSFRDSSGRDWSLSITVASARKLKNDGFDLKDATDGSLIGRLSEDPYLLADMLWSLCETDATKQSVTADDFAASLGPDAIDSAVDALIEEIIDFFPRARREAMRRLWMKAKAIEAEKIEEAVSRFEAGGSIET